MPAIVLIFFALQLNPADREAVEKAMQQLARFEVRFRQETYSDFFDPTLAEGILKLERPGKMRMDYRKGEQKTLIWDGTVCYEHDILAETKTRTAQDELKDQPLVRLLLYGDDLHAHFLVDRSGSKQEPRFRLRPRDGAEYTISIRFDAEWVPKFLDIGFEDGEGTRFWFDQFNRTPNFTAEDFTVPKSD